MKNKKKKLFSLLLLSFFFVLILSTASAAWWDSSWLNKKPINIWGTHSTITATNTFYKLDINTLEMNLDGNIQADCGDLRVIQANGLNEVPLYISPENDCNVNGITTIYFKSNISIPADTDLNGGSATGYWLYYNNAGATNFSNNFDAVKGGTQLTLGDGNITTDTEFGGYLKERAVNQQATIPPNDNLYWLSANDTTDHWIKTDLNSLINIAYLEYYEATGNNLFADNNITISTNDVDYNVLWERNDLNTSYEDNNACVTNGTALYGKVLRPINETIRYIKNIVEGTTAQSGCTTNNTGILGTQEIYVFKDINANPTLTLGDLSIEANDTNYLLIKYIDNLTSAGSKPDSWIIKGTDYISYCDSNGFCMLPDLNGWTTEQYSITATKNGADTNILQPTFGETQSFNGIGTLILKKTKIVLINEDDGTVLTTVDFNGDAPKHIKKIIIYDINGNFIYDFNASSTTTYDIDLNSSTSAYNIEITYNNAGLDVTYKKEFNFNYVFDANTNICVAPLQNFFEQIFTSVQEKRIVVYLPTSNCYSLAGNLRNIYQQGQFTNVYTINKTYQAYTTDSDGVKTFLAWVNGGSEYSHDLDAIEFNQQDLEIIVGYDTLAFNPLINSITNKYDENILQIYWKSYYGKYTSTNLRIFNPDGNVLLYELTEDINANEFTLNWDWNAYNFTDENILKIIVIGTTANGIKTTTTEYFNVLGQEYIGTQNPTFIAAMVLIFFLFGITLTSIGKTFGWIGIIVCITSMAISAMALPGHYWIALLQAGLFICFLYIILNGGGTQSYSAGVVR